MNNDDAALMEKYGITSQTKTIYAYKQHRYDNLKDALRYAEIDTERDLANESVTAHEK